MLARHALGLLLLLTTSALPGYTQRHSLPSSAFSIGGAVRDNDDQHGLRKIRVALKGANGIPVRATFTRQDGAFEFSGLPSGEYILEVKVKDYEPLRQTVEIANSSRQGLSLFVKRPVILADAIANASISAHQLGAPLKAQDEFDKGMNLLYEKFDSRAAIVQFQRAIKDFPTFYEAYALIGTAHQNLGEMPAAEEAFRKSVDLSAGQYANALNLLSAFLSDTNRYQEAATFARKSMAVDAASWRGPFELARALCGLKQYEEAEKSAVQARDRNPENPDVYLLLANAHIGRRDYPALGKDLDAYLKIAPNGPDADRVRKTREKLQAAEKQREEEPDADSEADGNDVPDVQDSAGANEPSAAREKSGVPATPGPDSSGLPPLPPPSPSGP